MSWMDRTGKLSPLRATAADWRHPQFSADGRRILMSIHDGTSANVWVYDWARDALSRITFDSGDQPSWTPEGARVSFLFDSQQITTRPAAGQPAGSPALPTREDGLYWTRADGTGPIESLTKGTFGVSGLAAVGPGMEPAWIFGGKASWNPDGEHLAFVSQAPRGGTDISVVEVKADGKGGFRPDEPRPLVATAFTEWDPAFSPDGRFLAYTSDESGQHEVYVRPFPPGDGKWQVSTQGGAFPEWSRATSEIVFFSPRNNRLMSVPYVVKGGSFEPGKVRPWADTPILRAAIGAPFALHPDGNRVVVRGPANDANRKSDTAVLWLDGFAALRRLTEEASRP